MTGKAKAKIWTTSAILGLTFFCSAALQPITVTSVSMERSFEPGQVVLADVLPWRLRREMPALFRPRRGEVVILHRPDAAGLFIKRIIGLPGERIHLAHGVVFVNGRALKEPYVQHRRSGLAGAENWPLAPNGQPAPDVVVPRGSVFVLGDNRDLSSDSRQWGSVAEDDLVGSVWRLP